MQVKSIAECFLQYFQPSVSYHLSFRSVFSLFLSGRLRQVLLYMHLENKAILLLVKRTRITLKTVWYDTFLHDAQNIFKTICMLGRFNISWIFGKYHKCVRQLGFRSGPTLFGLTWIKSVYKGYHMREKLCQRGSNFDVFLVDEGWEDPNTTISGISSAR